MNIAIAIGIFLSIILFVEGGYYFYHQYVNPKHRHLKRRLRSSGAITKKETSEATSLVRNRKLSELPWLHELLASLNNLGGLEKLLQQANSHLPVGLFLLISAVVGALGLMMALLMDYGFLAGLGAGFVGCLIPLIWIKMKRRKRFQAFERQLPEGLDLMARALRAGHAFSVGMKMVGDEFPDPIGPEFSRTVEEISFGIDVPEAMNNLNDRVISTDLKFFVTALVVQRETGGNLAEIIEAISRLIRQRFELFGRVKAISAEGRLSGIILFFLPIVMAGILWWISPDYIGLLFSDELGQMMMAGSVFLMLLGAFVMKNMCNIKV